MNIIHVITGKGPTGAAAAAINDVKALRAAGHRAYLAPPADGAVMKICAAEAVPCIGGLKLGRGARRILNLPHDARWLRKMIRELSIEIVHTHRSDDQLLARLALRPLPTRLIRTWHRDPQSLPVALLPKLAAQVDGCVAVSREHSAALKAAGAPRSAFIHAAVDTAIFHPPDAALQFAGEGKPPALCIGHVGRWKRERSGRDRGQRAALGRPGF